MGASSRTNELRRTLDAGDVALGVLENTYSPTLVEFFGELRLDFVWLDLKHAGPSPWNADRLDDLLRAADSTEMELLVRLPTPEPGLVRKALDAGVRTSSSHTLKHPKRFVVQSARPDFSTMVTRVDKA